MYVNQACHIKTNQVHVGRVLADKQEINESTFEIFVRILLISNHMIFSGAIWNIRALAKLENFTRVHLFQISLGIM